jgi:D-proline reductase (dithiol) PrdB
MLNLFRLKNQVLSRVISRNPSVAKFFIKSYVPLESEDIPWTPVTKLLQDCKIAIITTAGVHHRDQKPFDMNDPNGDPTFREIDLRKPVSDLMITHDYYDHSDADKDINIVFPIERLREFEAEKNIGRLANCHYGFMGHIVGHHINTLINVYAPEVAERMKQDDIDLVLLTPG